jgi:hypothetical protein
MREAWLPTPEYSEYMTEDDSSRDLLGSVTRILNGHRPDTTFFPILNKYVGYVDVENNHNQDKNTKLFIQYCSMKDLDYVAAL